MKWLRSTTVKSYVAHGYVIPAYNKEPVAVPNDAYQKISAMSVIKSLVKTGNIVVYDNYKAKSTDAADMQDVQNLRIENARLADQLREKEAALANAGAAPTKSEVKAAKKAQAEAEAKLAELQARYDALEKEANDKIAELSKAQE